MGTLTIKDISEDDKRKFKEFCAMGGYSMSSFLKGSIKNCIGTPEQYNNSIENSISMKISNLMVSEPDLIDELLLKIFPPFANYSDFNKLTGRNLLVMQFRKEIFNLYVEELNSINEHIDH